MITHIMEVLSCLLGDLIQADFYILQHPHNFFFSFCRKINMYLDGGERRVRTCISVPTNHLRNKKNYFNYHHLCMYVQCQYNTTTHTYPYPHPLTQSPILVPYISKQTNKQTNNRPSPPTTIYITTKTKTPHPKHNQPETKYSRPKPSFPPRASIQLPVSHLIDRSAGLHRSIIPTRSSQTLDKC